MLKFSRLACTRPGSSAAAMSLTEVLPVEPVIPTTGQPSSRRTARASRCSASSGSAAREDPAAGLGRGQARRRAPGRRRPPRRRPRAPPAACSPPSMRSPRRPKNRSPAPRLARVDHGALRRARSALGDDLAAGLGRRSAPPRADHRFTAGEREQLLAGDLAVVERDLAAALELLALLVALAGDRRPCRRARRRRARARSPRAGRARPRSASRRCPSPRGSRR